MAQVGPVKYGSAWTSEVWLRLGQWSVIQVRPVNYGSGWTSIIWLSLDQ